MPRAPTGAAASSGVAEALQALAAVLLAACAEEPEILRRGAAGDAPGVPGAPEVAASLEGVRGSSLVLVNVDTLAANHMSLYGYERETTPYLERLARESVVFLSCRANAPWTTPSTMSQLTGLLPSAFRPRSGDEEGRAHWFLADRHRPLPEMLSDAGYRTAAFVDNVNVGPELGFSQGFEVYDTTAAEISKFVPGGGIDHIVPRALAWLDGLDGERPFFLFLQPLDVHGPYLPPEPWRGSFCCDGLHGEERDLKVSSRGSPVFPAIPKYVARPYLERTGPATALPVAPIVAAYDEGVRAMDAALEAFLGALDERGLLGGCVVVVTSDHGESLTGHESYFLHERFYEDVLRVPLLIRLPGALLGGLRVEPGVQLVDLYPTLLELAGIGLPAVRLDGHSLLPLLAGAEREARPSFAEDDRFGGVSIVVRGWKLIETPKPSRRNELLNVPRVRRALEELRRLHGARFGEHLDAVLSEIEWPQYELYHLDEDPGETAELSSREPERLARMIAELEEMRPRLSELRDTFGHDAPATAPTPEVLKRLGELGYGGGR